MKQAGRRSTPSGPRVEREPLETRTGRRRARGTRRQTADGVVETRRVAERTADRSSAPGSAGRRFRYRSVDLPARGAVDRRHVQRHVPRRPHRPSAAEPGLHAPEAGASRTRARRRGDRKLAPKRLASHQKKGHRQQATIVFLDETGFMLQPLNRRTWAPRGETPVQYAWDRRDRLSVIGALTLSPVRQRIGFYFGRA